MTTKSENGIRLVQECVAGENAQDYDRMYSVFGETATYYLNGEILGSAPTADFRDLEKQTTPGIYGNSHREIQWIDGNDTRVVYQYKIQFNHNGEVFGFPPTGRRVEFHGVSIAEHDGNEIRLIRLFADQGEMNRQLSGKLRTPGTVSAALEGPPIPEGERARYEAIGARLIRAVYEAENARDIEKQLACYADPLLDHFAGRANTMSMSAARRILPAWWASLPGLHREIEEVLAFGNRAILRWHMTAEPMDGKPVDQHGCSVIEHDGERIAKFWAYYPDLAQVLPAVLGLE
ncbi:MAG: ester cyclase [Dehalococcoidia bacterium]|jgi:predicted ester cyclase|uniref:ester cyclase n=1 Tax=Candidatus Amarobacter glycogenicus TaxID=3140699 RepID=UPI003136DA10|nr:ester cyclase [Dehalococcoidia bacterium]